MKKLYFAMISFLSIASVLHAQLRYNYAPYSVNAQHNYPLKSSPITLSKVLKDDPHFTTYEGYYITMQRKMSLFIGVPKGTMEPSKKAIIMVRGFQQHYNYTTGQAIKEIAEQYLLAGFVVIAPDFFGFADSSEAPIGTANSAETYLIMPINTSELYLSLSKGPIFLSHGITPNLRPQLPDHFSDISLWGEGNGGFVALHTLAIVSQPIPTILWSPVTTDFAQAWAFFKTQYSAVAGKSAQKFSEEFRRFYDPQKYNILDNLHYIAANTFIRLHHGQKNAQIPIAWSETLIRKVNEENQRRKLHSITPIHLLHTFHPNADSNLIKSVPSIIANDIAWLHSLKSSNEKTY